MSVMDLQANLYRKYAESQLPAQTGLQEAIHERHQTVRDRTIQTLKNQGSKRCLRWAVQLSGCASTARFYIDPTARKVKPWLNRCRHKLCPLCARARSAHVADQLHALLVAMPRPRTILITVKSTTMPLGDQLADLRNWFKKLRDTAAWKKSVAGGAYTLEITINPKTHLWHPHLHIVYDGEFFPVKVLRNAWRKITGDSYIIGVQDVGDKLGMARELAKYIGKPQHIEIFSDAELCEYAFAINGKRMVQTFGNCHGRTVEDKDPGEPNSPETYSVGLRRLVFLAERGAETPLRLVALIAKRWPLFGSFIYHRMPQIEPDLTPAEKLTRLHSFLSERPPPAQRSPPPAEDVDQLDAKLLTLFSRYRLENEQGDYLVHDLYD
ncbi:hypothetical protein ES705_34102 [subsurface metagenome]